MTLSSRQKKLWHSVVIGFVTGALTTLQMALMSGLTEKKAIIAAGIGVVTAGLARAVGAVLAWVETEPEARKPDARV